MRVELTLNGEKISADVPPRMLLVHFLREERDLTGTHVGCETSICGACFFSTLALRGIWFAITASFAWSVPGTEASTRPIT